MDTSAIKDLTTAIYVLMAGLGVTGVLGALAFFGFTARRIIQILPALLGLVFFAIAIPLTVSRLQRPVTYESRANPEEVQVVQAESRRIDVQKVLVKVVLNRPGQVFLKYKAAGRDFIVPVASQTGSSRVTTHDFYIAKTDPVPGSVIVVVEGEDRDVLVIR